MLRDWETLGYCSSMVSMVRTKRAREEHLLAFTLRLDFLVDLLIDPQVHQEGGTATMNISAPIKHI